MREPHIQKTVGSDGKNTGFQRSSPLERRATVSTCEASLDVPPSPIYSYHGTLNRNITIPSNLKLTFHENKKLRSIFFKFFIVSFMESMSFVK